MPSGDLRRRLGKKSVPNQSESKSEETSPTDVKTEAERIVVRYVNKCAYVPYTGSKNFGTGESAFETLAKKTLTELTSIFSAQ